MIKFLGRAEMPGVCLKYFVFGNRRDGYGIRIKNENGETKNQFVSNKLSYTIALGNQLRRCFVFSETLPEILEDLQVESRDSSYFAINKYTEENK